MRIQSRIGSYLPMILAAAAFGLQPACGGKTAAGSANGAGLTGGDAAQTGGDGGGGGDAAQGGDPGSTTNAAPTVTITNPTDGSYLYYPTGGTAPSSTLRGSVTDDTTVLAQNIAWTVTAPDGTTTTNQGTIGGAGTTVTTRYAFTFDQQGAYTIKLAYTDAGGLSGSQTITVTVTNNVPPQVTITNPPNTGGTANPTNPVIQGDQLTLQGTVREIDGDTVTTSTIQWSVTDPSGQTTNSTAGANVTCNGTNTSCQTTYTYTFASTGDYTITLTDNDGTNPAVVVTITLTVHPNTPPTCQITSPTSGAAVPPNSPLQVSAVVNDPDQPNGSLTVDWFLGDTSGTPVVTGPAGGSTTTATLTIGAATAACQPQTIICRVTDNQGATGQDSVTTALNTPPTIQITDIQDATPQSIMQPTANFFDTSAATPATPITVQVNANDQEDSQGTGADMTLQVFDSLTGQMVATTTLNPSTATTATLTWTPPPNIASGKHTLLATVADSCGTTTTVQADFVADAQLTTIQPLAATNNWNVYALALSGGTLYAGYRTNGNDYLASVNPTATTNAVTDLTTVLGRVSRRVRSIIVAGNQLYVGTNDGMVGCPVANLATPTQQSCTSVQQYTNANGNQVADPQTDSLLALPDGSLVAGTDRGVVFMADPNGNLGQGVHCLDNPVVALAYDPISDAIFGSQGGGGFGGNYAFRWDRPFDSCDGITRLDNTNTPMIPAGNGARGDDLVNAVTADSTGVWFGTANPSLLHLDTGSMTWTVYRPNNSPLVAADGINTIAVQENDTLGGSGATPRDIIWTGVAAAANTNPSVLRRDEVLPTWTAFTAANDGLPSPIVTQIVIAPDGTKWIATANGIASYNWQ